MRRVYLMWFFGLIAVPCTAEKPSLTVYNDNFAVVREVIPLTLKKGVNEISQTDVTAQLEPESVMLRDLKSSDSLRVLEQNYRADPLSQGLLLKVYEGKMIQFEVPNGQNAPLVAKGKVIRSGYVPQGASPENNASSDPIIDMDGQIRFGLPGTPLFPGLGDDTILRPTLTWQLESAVEGSTQAELSYVTRGLSWDAQYNLVLPPKGDQLDLIGWVTMKNESGKQFDDATIQLMAGDVQKTQPPMAAGRMMMKAEAMADYAEAPQVKEKAFDEYHLYTLPRNTSLRDRQTKQIEFLNALGVNSTMNYVYDGTNMQPIPYDMGLQLDRNFGLDSNTKVRVTREFMNEEKNHLGMPLPKGNVRMYRRDEQGRLQFIGENQIDHTPRDEKVKLESGNAFDLTGKRVQTNFVANEAQQWMDESFEITLKNHKDTAVSIQVHEHLYRYTNWKINNPSAPFEKLDSRTIRFTVEVPARGEQKITYTAHYSWNPEADQTTGNAPAAAPAVTTMEGQVSAPGSAGE